MPSFEEILLEELNPGKPVVGLGGFGEKTKNSLDYLFGLLGSLSGSNVPNMSFDIDSDDDGDPDSWTVADYAGGSHSLDAVNAAHGAHSLKFIHPGGAGNGGGYADSDYIECSAQLPFLVKFLHSCSQSGVKVQVVVRYFSEAKLDLSADETIYSQTVNPTVLTPVTTDMANPPASAKYCKIRLIGGYPDTNPVTITSIWFDAVSIRPLPIYSASATGFIVGAACGVIKGSSVGYEKVAEGVSPAKGTLYSEFILYNDGDGSAAVFARVYVNGIAVGAEHSVQTGGLPTTKVDASITVDRGDLVQLYVKGSGSSGAQIPVVNGWVLRSSSGDEALFNIQAKNLRPL